MSLDVQASYDLAKKLPDMRFRGLRIETSYGEVEIDAQEAGLVIDAIEVILRRRLAASEADHE